MLGNKPTKFMKAPFEKAIKKCKIIKNRKTISPPKVTRLLKKTLFTKDALFRHLLTDEFFR